MQKPNSFIIEHIELIQKLAKKTVEISTETFSPEFQQRFSEYLLRCADPLADEKKLAYDLYFFGGPIAHARGNSG